MSWHILQNENILCILSAGHFLWKVSLALILFLDICALPYYRVGEVPHTCFTTHMLQNKKLLSLLLKQWHLKMGYTDRAVSFNTFKQYILLP